MPERRPVVEFEGIYEVSADGDVFTLARALPARGGKTRHVPERKHAPQATARGYLTVTLQRDTVARTYPIHRLVLEAFVGRCPPGLEAWHLDGNPANNHLENLRWGDPSPAPPPEFEPSPPLVHPQARDKAKSWRKESRSQVSGTTWRLLRGRNEERVRLSLGLVSEADADKALARIQAEEDSGTVQRILALHQHDEAAAVLYLVGDPDVDALVPDAPVDHGAMSLREYVRTIYSAWRQEDAAASWRGEEGYWKRILSELGTLRLREVDAHVVADYIDALKVERGKRKGQSAAGNTKRLHRTALQALLNYAHRQKHIAAHIDLAVFRIKGSTKVVTERADPLNLDELGALMEASEPKHRTMWAVGVGQGLRPSELLRICWEDVRWESRTLLVRGRKTAEASAEIPLTPLAHHELQAWWMRQGQPVCGIAFPGKKDAAYLAESGYKKALATAARKAGIERPVTPYLLRHSFATIAWSLGIEQDVARRVMRHVDLAMLDKVYCRPRPAELVAKVAAFARPKT